MFANPESTLADIESRFTAPQKKGVYNRLMKIKGLKAFALVVSEGSLLAAGTALELSEAAVSRLISDLEKDSGLKLFDRERRQLSLTDEGAKFHIEALRTLESFEQLPALASGIKQSREEFLNVVTMPRVASAVVAPAVAEFTRSNPRVNIKIDIRTRSDGDVWFGSAVYDVGVGSLPIFHPRVISQKHLCLDVMCMVPAAHRLTNLHRRLSPADIAYENLITQGLSTLDRKQMEAWFRNGDAQLCQTIETNSPDLLGALVAEGAGISLVDALAVSGVSSERYALLQVENPYSIDYGTLWFCPPETRKQSAIELSHLFEKHLAKWA
jgi:DNA-binding transcriptional LysR family regulator